MAAQASAEDAKLDGWVPSLDHATFDDWNRVYEPSEDTFLLLDALFADRAALRASKTIVEIGPGSGVVATYLAKLTRNNVLAVDINEAACALTMRTADANGARVDVVVEVAVDVAHGADRRDAAVFAVDLGREQTRLDRAEVECRTLGRAAARGPALV